MRVYAEKPIRAALQLLLDLVVVAWIVTWVRFAFTVQTSVLEWQALGHRMINAGGELERTFLDASSTAGRIMFVGDDLSDVLGRGTVAGDVLAEVGRREIETVDYSATGIAVLLVVVALIPVLAWWLPRRVRYTRAASNAVAMRADAGDLLALHALTTAPYRRLRKIAAAPSAAWRQGDADVIEQLANLRLAKSDCGPSNAPRNRSRSRMPVRARPRSSRLRSAEERSTGWIR